MKLVLCSRSDIEYKIIRDRHYVANHGCIGKQLHYLIYEGEGILEQPIGIISGASAIWASEYRDKFFGINKGNRIEKIDKIIDNVVFRLEKNNRNYGSQIMALWRKTILKDWTKRYGTEVIGFETFVFGKERFGTIYKADNWTYVGQTKGSAKYKPHGAYNIGERKKTEIKLIFCKIINLTNII